MADARAVAFPIRRANQTDLGCNGAAAGVRARMELSAWHEMSCA